jgi:hypothetical protein
LTASGEGETRSILHDLADSLTHKYPIETLENENIYNNISHKRELLGTV